MLIQYVFHELKKLSICFALSGGEPFGDVTWLGFIVTPGLTDEGS
jgi:hypothetical protein